MTNVEIGVTVTSYLYLTSVGSKIRIGFDASKIKDIVEAAVGGTILMYEDIEHTPVDGPDKEYVHAYVVEESKKDIEDAIKEAASYKDAAINTISSMTGTNQPS